MVMRGGIGRKGQMVMLGRAPQVVENASRLNNRLPPVRIDGEDTMEIFRHIEYDSDVAALSGQTGASSPGQNGRVEPSARGNRFHDVFSVFRDDDADGRLPVVRAVRGVERPAAVVKPHFAFCAFAQLGREPGSVDLGALPALLVDVPCPPRFLHLFCQNSHGSPFTFWARVGAQRPLRHLTTAIIFCTAPHRRALALCRGRVARGRDTTLLSPALPRRRKAFLRSLRGRESTLCVAPVGWRNRHAYGWLGKCGLKRAVRRRRRGCLPGEWRSRLRIG